MRVFFRVNFLSLVLALAASSCNPAATITPSAVTPVPQVVNEAPVFTAIPKQNDLVFIEFFAGT